MKPPPHGFGRARDFQGDAGSGRRRGVRHRGVSEPVAQATGNALGHATGRAPSPRPGGHVKAVGDRCARCTLLEPSSTLGDPMIQDKVAELLTTPCV